MPRALIEAGINVNQADYAGWTALHEACIKGHAAVVEELLLAGADVNSRGLEGLTPLHDAVASDHYETVQLLLQYGSNPNDKNAVGQSPLDMACHEGIKDLLSTYRGNFETQPKGSSESITECQTGVRKKNSVPCFCCEGEATLSGVQPSKKCSSESIITALEKVERKQNEMSTWKLSGPEDPGKFNEAFSQIQNVLNDVLNKHKAENRDLTRKYRIASDSFKQGILREQLTSLASRQKRLLNLLQKQNVLKLGAQTQRRKKMTRQTATQSTTAGENKSEDILHRINTSPYRITEQEAPLSRPGVSTENVFQCISGRGDTNIEPECSDSAHITSDTELVEPESADDELIDTEVADPCENIAGNEAYGGCGTPETQVCSTPTETPTGPVQSKTSYPAHQAPLPFSFQGATSSSSDKQRVPVANMNVTGSSHPQMSFLPVSSSTPSTALMDLRDHQQATQPSQTALTVVSTAHGNILSSSWSHYQPLILCQPLDLGVSNLTGLNAHQTIAGVNKCCTSAGEILPTSVSLQNVQVSRRVESNVSQTRPRNRRESSIAPLILGAESSHTALSVDNEKSAPEAAVSNAVSPDGDSASDNRPLKNLIHRGVIKPGDNVLKVTLKGSCYKASLQPDGSIKDSYGQLFLTPEQWVASLPGHNIPVSLTFAFKKVMYKSKSLSRYLMTADLGVTQAAASKQGFTPDGSSAAATVKEAPTKTSVSSFMEINKILLISDEEFMPCHLMDCHWAFFSKYEDWETLSESH
ncbi:hypothetical protein MATL_G00066580 [Megalops atlanticus]|uniref:RAMA domain-containing protein n=1 Tax=Megalops atlanticus TaxID=7932 RepID=A0A9D3TGC7_MEGAT|nr:hypothetical protein MATL_G00066580 [Megalops atlanticus]